MYRCSECGATSIKWVGRCPECRNYNTMEEIAPGIDQPDSAVTRRFSLKPPPFSPVTPATADSFGVLDRIKTGINEFDVSVGGGLVKGQSILIGGDPGIGKSTLLLQVSEKLSSSGIKVLYVSSEESLEQLLLRVKRLKITTPLLSLTSLNDIAEILYTIDNGDYGFVVIDSIQRVNLPDSRSAFGGINSLREVAHGITEACLKKNCGVFLIGHVTKEGNFAGPKTLEHIVDTVLYFDSGKRDSYRILRCYKNRFGSTDEIGVYEMSESGLLGVKNPSSFFVEEKRTGSPGSIITPCIEGTRSFLVEIQALAVNSFMAYPKRVCLGLDSGRVHVIAAVLEKKEGIKLSSKEIYVKIFGGINIQEPSADLPVAVSIISSCLDKVVPSTFIAFGEIGLTGEVRGVSRAAIRVKEAVRSGFTDIIMPEANVKDIKNIKEVKSGVNIRPVSRLKKIIEYLS